MSRQNDKMKVFTSLAQQLGSLSTCRRLSVGCIIIPRDLTGIYALGYNGPPAGLPNDLCSVEKGDCGCIHAEANAIAKLSTPDRQCLLITTVSPCRHCAGLIINCNRISEVLYLSEYRDSRGIEMMKKVGISTKLYR